MSPFHIHFTTYPATRRAISEASGHICDSLHHQLPRYSHEIGQNPNPCDSTTFLRRKTRRNAPLSCHKDSSNRPNRYTRACSVHLSYRHSHYLSSPDDSMLLVSHVCRCRSFRHTRNKVHASYRIGTNNDSLCSARLKYSIEFRNRYFFLTFVHYIPKIQVSAYPRRRWPLKRTRPPRPG